MDFKPTHEITLSGDRNETIPVMLVEGAAYTQEEWDACSNADWEVSDSGAWLFQGRVAPHCGVEVAVKRLHKHWSNEQLWAGVISPTRNYADVALEAQEENITVSQWLRDAIEIARGQGLDDTRTDDELFENLSEQLNAEGRSL